MASSVTVYSIAQSIQQPGLLEKDNLARYRVNLPRRCQVGYRGALCCCCPPRSESDEEAPLVASPGVHIGKRGTHVEVAGQGRGILVRGEGSALADTVIEQDAAYWEVRVLDLGAECHIGVAYELSGHLLDSQLGDRSCSWTLSQELHRGDVIGVAFGQGDIPNLRSMSAWPDCFGALEDSDRWAGFFRNGQQLDDATVSRVRGEAYPAVSVSGGAELLLVFDEKDFEHAPPGRHSEVRPPRKMM
ncbi:unnamed protein product [Prorocentrum cordatum]|uniref:B30.2/SPRY domain-containing protein n=1 Tax=Prorocentrum cordatum TaxID=2364126 RepID=A0ABN9VMJ6_9DINO|nr:unnamed protein product [Polarella glacialis]